MNWSTFADGLASLFDQGGVILWGILGASFLLWCLILERYWFHWRVAAGLKAQLKKEWHAQAGEIAETLSIRRVKAFVEDLRAEANRNVLALNALVGILPLLGLLGTVSGMIKVFEVITVFGSGNTRGMASGISEALVTTMAGLFTALSAVYFVHDIERRAQDLARRFEREMVEGR